MSVVYNGAHSITFIEALDSDTDSTPTAYSSYKRSWRDFHLVPEKRPSVNPPSPALKLIDIPGTNRRIDMTDLMPGGLKFGRRQGEWQFILDHDLWDNWHVAKKTIEDAINGKRLYCILEDDFNTAYRGRFRVQGWQSGPNYSSISISYDLEYKKYTNVFSIMSDETENKMVSSWASVDSMIKDGSYKNNIAIYDTCYLYIPGLYQDYMEVAAIDIDQGESYSVLPVTWIAKKLLDIRRTVNPYGTQATFYQSDLANYLDSTGTYSGNDDGLMSKLPNRLKSMIKKSRRSSRTYDTSIITFLQGIWIPSYREVYGGTNVETSGAIYTEIFGERSKRIRSDQKQSITDWYTRSAYGTGGFYHVEQNGSEGRDNASGPSRPKRGILIGFCTGASS